MSNPYFDFGAFLEAFPKLLSLLPYTLFTVCIILVLSLVFAVLLVWLRLRKNTIVSGIVRLYIMVIRGIPLMLLLFVVYYGLPVLLQLWGINTANIQPLPFVIVAFTLSTSAFEAEVIRAAYESIDQGQMEAAQSLSLPAASSFFHILVPQIFVLALPNLGNLIITAIKQSSIMYTIGVMDIYQKARTLSADHFGVWQLEIFLALMFIYWGVALLIDFAIAKLYKKMLIYIP